MDFPGVTLNPIWTQAGCLLLKAVIFLKYVSSLESNGLMWLPVHYASLFPHQNGSVQQQNDYYFFFFPPKHAISLPKPQPSSLGSCTLLWVWWQPRPHRAAHLCPHAAISVRLWRSVWPGLVGPGMHCCGSGTERNTATQPSGWHKTALKQTQKSSQTKSHQMK